MQSRHTLRCAKVRRSAAAGRACGENTHWVGPKHVDDVWGRVRTAARGRVLPSAARPDASALLPLISSRPTLIGRPSSLVSSNHHPASASSSSAQTPSSYIQASRRPSHGRPTVANNHSPCPGRSGARADHGARPLSWLSCRADGRQPERQPAAYESALESSVDQVRTDHGDSVRSKTPCP